MGTGMSLPKETVVIGKTNSNAPDLFRSHEIPSINYPYELFHKRESFADIELAFALESFNSIVSCKLNAHEDYRPLSIEDMERFKLILNPAKNLQNALIMGEDAKELRIEVNVEDRQIYLCRKNIVELNESICKHKSISILQICCNYLRYLPYGIGQLKNLKMLILARNRITTLPEEIGMCKDLREIDISQNLIKDLPKSLACLKRLNTLQLSSNKLTEIPEFIGKMQSLKYLNLSFNKITSIPLEVFKLPFLMNINTSGCNLSIKDRKSFTVVGKLTLIETVARHIIRQNIPIKKNISKDLVNYILDVQECSFCNGPFFDHYVTVEDVHVFESEVFPVHYKMCCKHYERHEDRITTLFEQDVYTFPTKIYEEYLPSVTELFEPCSYEDGVIQRAKEASKTSDTIPLICLSEQNLLKYRQNMIDNFFSSDHENPNIFDFIFSRM